MIKRQIEKTLLNNGLVILSESLPQAHTVGLGIWLRAGSRHESALQNGLTHFIEHAVFKGTTTRSAQQLAREADILGGGLDAFTTREFTGYYFQTLAEHLPAAFDILADLVTAPRFLPTDMEKERQVILEEIKMIDDNPEELLAETFNAVFWPNHPLGRPITGTTASVTSFSPEQIAQYYQHIYHRSNLIIVAVGQISHTQLLDLVARYFNQLPNGTALSAPLPPPPNQAQLAIIRKRHLEQTHLMLGVPSPNLGHPHRYTCSLLATILGGGLSSRLFQTIREDHGLAYNIYTGLDLLPDTGCLTIYLAVANDRVNEALQLTLQELRKLKLTAVPAVELTATKQQIKTALLLGLDSISSRVNSLAEDEISFGHPVSIDEILDHIDQVTAEDLQQLAIEIFQPTTITLAALATKNKLPWASLLGEC
jgi:predicted Zn-dependent peptidase